MLEVEPALRLAPLSVPWGDTISAWGGSACALCGPGRGQWGGDEEENRRRDTEPNGSGQKPPWSIECQIDKGRQAPWGCVAGAPYWGTASPPPPPESQLCTEFTCQIRVVRGLPCNERTGHAAK